MLHLTLNPDDTFELRWIEYYSESGFTDITREKLLKGSTEKMSELEKDLIVEKNMASIVEGNPSNL